MLINQEQRELYNKFGTEGLTKNFIDANAILLQVAVFYLTWGMMAYVLTLGKSSANSRNWIFSGMIVMLIVEVSLELQDVKLPEWFFPTVTEHEVVWLLHSLFPAYMNGCRSIGSYFFVDVDELTKATLAKLQASHGVRISLHTMHLLSCSNLLRLENCILSAVGNLGATASHSGSARQRRRRRKRRHQENFRSRERCFFC